MEFQRNQFTFYRSFYNAVRVLPKRARAQVLEAVIAYGLDGVELPLVGVAETVMTLILPVLESGRKKAAGCYKRNTGSAPDIAQIPLSSDPDSAQISPSSAPDIAQKKEKEKEIEIEKEIENESEAAAVVAAANRASRATHAPARATSAAAVEQSYRLQINPKPSNACLKELAKFTESLGAACCLHAIEIAADEGQRNWRYVRGILFGLTQQGVRSLKEWESIEAERDRQRGEVAEAERGRQRGEAKRCQKTSPQGRDEYTPLARRAVQRALEEE